MRYLLFCTTILLLLGHCVPLTNTNTTTMTDCQTAQNALQQRDFLDWQGLPSDCDWTPWTGALPEDWSEIPYKPLGSEYQRAHMQLLSLEGYYRPMLYFVEGKPVLFEARDPELAHSLSNLLEKLGTPAARLDWDYGTLPCSEAEWVYPKRGITLFLSEDHDRLFHIGLYAPCDLEHYNAYLRPNLGKKRR